MPTLSDLAKRLYDTFAETTHKFEPLTFAPLNPWEKLTEVQQEVWLTVAAEAVRAGAEVRKELDATRWAKIEQEWVDLRTSLAQMARGEGRVLVDVDEDLFVDIPTAEADEAPRLRAIADEPRRFVRRRRDCE